MVNSAVLPDGEVHDLDAERLPFLPKSVLAQIFSFLLPKDLVNLAATCSALRKFLLLPTSTSIWTRVHKNKAHYIPDVPDLPPKAHPHLLLLRDHYYDTIDTEHSAIRQEFPAFRELATLQGVRKRVDAAGTEEEITAIATWLINAVNAWRSRAHADLLAKLPQTMKSLYLAVAVFRRTSDPRPLFYPDMIMGDPYTIKDPLRSAPDESLQYSSVCAAMVAQMCELAGLNPTTTTSAQLDASRIRFCCSHCEPDWPLVLNWRQALHHACREHDGELVAWCKWASNTAERAFVFDGSFSAWTCLQCSSSRQGLLTRPSVRSHLSERHDVAHPREGIHFARSSCAQLPDPLTSVQHHAQEVHCTVLDEDDAKSNQSMWKCQYCPSFFEGVFPLEYHLVESHNVLLRIEWAVRTFRELQKKRKSASVPSPHPTGLALPETPASSSSKVDSPIPQPGPASMLSVQTDVGLPPKPMSTVSGQKAGVSKTPSATVDVLLSDGTTSQVRVGTPGNKVFGCAHCTSSKKMRDRAFAFGGVKTHLLAKHNKPNPIFEVDFLMHPKPGSKRS